MCWLINVSPPISIRHSLHHTMASMAYPTTKKYYPSGLSFLLGHIDPRFANHQQCNPPSWGVQQSPMWRFWKWSPSDRIHHSRIHSIDYKFNLESSTRHLYSIAEMKRMLLFPDSPLTNFLFEKSEIANYVSAERSSAKSFFVFKDGIPPLWEDQSNIAGGCWVYIVHTNEDEKTVWKTLIKMLCNPLLEPYLNEINGVTMTIRANQSYKLSIWTKDSSNITKIYIGNMFKTLIDYPGKLSYYSHQTTIGRENLKAFHPFSALHPNLHRMKQVTLPTFLQV